MAPIIAAHRRGVVEDPALAGRIVGVGAWIAVAVGLSAVLVALVAVVAMSTAVGVLSADLPDPTRLGLLASAITQLPPG